MMLRVATCLGLVAGILLATGCATAPKTFDYSTYRQHPPRSILVLPPTNDSVAVNAPYVYLSTITQPLAEAGYYVFPVAVIDAFMKENGLTNPTDMQSAPLNKIAQYIGPDAVLYTHINEWGQKYHVLSSDTTVDITARLVDTATGATLWTGKEKLVQGSSNGQGGLLAMVIVALVDQIANTAGDRTHEVSAVANAQMINDKHTGLPLGPYNPDHVTDPRRQ